MNEKTTYIRFGDKAISADFIDDNNFCFVLVENKKDGSILMIDECQNNQVTKELWQQLQTAKGENKKLTNYLMQLSFASGLISAGGEFRRCLHGGAFKEAIPNRMKALTQQNKQMREALEAIKLIAEDFNFEVDEAFETISTKCQQALKGGE